jgi:hypothetical protein
MRVAVFDRRPAVDGKVGDLADFDPARLRKRLMGANATLVPSVHNKFPKGATTRYLRTRQEVDQVLMKRRHARIAGSPCLTKHQPTRAASKRSDEAAAVRRYPATIGQRLPVGSLICIFGPRNAKPQEN